MQQGGAPTPYSMRCNACGQNFTTHLRPEAGASWAGRSAAPDPLAAPPAAQPSASIEPPKRSAPPAAASPYRPPPPATPKQPTYTIESDGQRYQVRDLATIQRWIVENRLSRDARLSSDGEWWDRIGDRPEFATFFQMLDRVQELEAAKAEPPAPPVSFEPPPVRAAQPAPTPPPAMAAPAPAPVPTPAPPPEPVMTPPPTLEEPEFTPPATEEIPFDDPFSEEIPLMGDSTREPEFMPSPKPASESLSETMPALGEEALLEQYPTFGEGEPPTEEEPLPESFSSPFDDPFGATASEPAHVPAAPSAPAPMPEPEPAPEIPSYNFDEEDWPTEQLVDHELDWVEGKRKKNRLVFGVVFLALAGFAGKTILSGKDEAPAGDVEEVVEVAEVAENIPEEAPPEAAPDVEEIEEVVVEEPPPAPAPAPPPPPQVQERRTPPPAPAPAPRRASREPETLDDFLSLGREAMSSGDYREARMAFLEATAIDPSSAPAFHGLAFAAQQQNDAPFALINYCKALRLSAAGSALQSEVRDALTSMHAECPE